MDYLNQFDENLLLNESNIFYLLKEVKDSKPYWEEEHPEDGEKLQNHMRDFFISLMKKQTSQKDDDFDSEEDSLCSTKKISFN